MNSLLWFLGAMALSVYLVLRWRIGDMKAVRVYFARPGGEKIFAGIVIFLTAGTIAAVASLLIRSMLPGEVKAAETGSGIEMFAFAEVYMGLDYTVQKQAPSCRTDGPNQQLTSNGGVRMNILQVDDGAFQLNSKYTHHSCVLNTDRFTYDGFGLEAVYRLW